MPSIQPVTQINAEAGTSNIAARDLRAETSASGRAWAIFGCSRMFPPVDPDSDPAFGEGSSETDSRETFARKSSDTFVARFAAV